MTLIKPSSFYIIMSFFVVAGTVKPVQVSLVKPVDYLLLKLFMPILNNIFYIIF